MWTPCLTRLPAALALGLLASCATRSSLPAERTPATTPSGPVVPAWSDAGASAFGIFAFQKVRDAASELDHLKAALNIAN